MSQSNVASAVPTLFYTRPIFYCNYSCQTLQGGQPEDFSALLFNQNLPLMEAWKDRMDDYLIETDKRFLPDRNKNFIIPTIYCIGSEIQHKEPTCLQKEREKVGTGTGNFFQPAAEPSQSADRQTGCSLNLTPLNPTEISLLDCENTFKPQANAGYVDIAAHTEHTQRDNGAARRFSSIKSTNLEPNDFTDTQRQAESWSEDYSRVKDVNGVNVVFLETAPVYTTCEEKDYTDNGRQETKTAPETALKEGASTEVMDSGYVDTVPHTDMM